MLQMLPVPQSPLAQPWLLTGGKEPHNVAAQHLRYLAMRIASTSWGPASSSNLQNA